VDEPVAIRDLHRFLFDWELHAEKPPVPENRPERNERIAVIGSGPAGLSCAYFLAKEGYKVVVYERLPIAGGMLAAGIPEFRLPLEMIQAEIQAIKDMGVEIRTGVHVGGDMTFEVLRKQGFRAIFLGIGAQECKRLGIEGEHLEGVYPGVDFLRDVRLGRKISPGPRIAVVGGGNVAMDAVRTVRRIGARKAFVLYRRTIEDMPADKDEIAECTEEGIEIKTLIAPVRIIGEKGRVKSIECIRMKAGEIDGSGRRPVIPIEGTEFILEVDGVIPAIGQESEWSCLGPDCACTLSEWGTMRVNPLTFQTNEPDVFSGGDAVSGPGTVVEAVEAGKQASISIHRFVNGLGLQEGREQDWSSVKIDASGAHSLPRVRMGKIGPSERSGNFKEIALGLLEKDAAAEAERCLSCECEACVKQCEFLSHYGASPMRLAKGFAGGEFRDPQLAYSCTICGLCQELCPENLHVGKMCMELREELVKEGRGPLKAHGFVTKNQAYAVSDSFFTVLPSPGKEKCERVFFPGCSLSGYSPSLVLACYDHLREKLPGTGIVLGCCGKQTLCLGDKPGFEQVMHQTMKAFNTIGASEIIVACPECYSTFKEFGTDLTLTFVSDSLLQTGFPERRGEGQIFSLHDSCATRSEKGLQESVRTLIRRLGFEIEEMEFCREKTRCCGMGGMVAFANPKLAGRFTKLRAEEAEHDLLTYCASCREALGGFKPALHMLDLVFNKEWEPAKGLSPLTGKVRRENQARLRTMLLEREGER
jgi:NADPH-dependent glutamate synthase beta subunit-like oxidoreductase